MVSPGGYQVTPGLYRVPDLLTEDQFVDYMKTTYGRDVVFADSENSVNTDRALGRTTPMGVLDEDAPAHSFRDPVLKRINEMNFHEETRQAVADAAQESKTTKTTSSKSK